MTRRQLMTRVVMINKCFFHAPKKDDYLFSARASRGFENYCASYFFICVYPSSIFVFVPCCTLLYVSARNKFLTL